MFFGIIDAIIYCMNLTNKQQSFYLQFPIYQILYVLVWMPVGFIISFSLSLFFVKILSFVAISIMRLFFPITIDMFVMSGMMRLIEFLYFITAGIVYDIMLLIVGLEYIISIINKKKLEISYDK